MTRAAQDLPWGPTFGARAHTWFLTGLFVAGPLAVTRDCVWWFVNTVGTTARTIVPSRFLPDACLPFHVPGFGVVIALFGLTILGFFAANLAGRTAIELIRKALRAAAMDRIYEPLLAAAHLRASAS